MKTPLYAALALILMFAVVQLLGCVPGLTSTKRSGESTKPLKAGDSPPVAREFDTTDMKAADEKAGQKVAGRAPVAPTPPKKSGPGGQEPEYNPPPSPEKSTVAPIDPAEKEEIRRAALEFAKNVPNVMHKQIRHSKLYGGWHLFLFVKPKGKIMLHEYAWNRTSKEWEVLLDPTRKGPQEIPGDKLKGYLTATLPGEQLFDL